MDKVQRKVFDLSKIMFLSLPLIYSASINAAKPINLRHQPVSKIHSLVTQSIGAESGAALEETGRSVDFNGTLHIFVKETYRSHPIWGGDAAIHVPKSKTENLSLSRVINAEKSQNTTMNGTIYDDLKTDLVMSKNR